MQKTKKKRKKKKNFLWDVFPFGFLFLMIKRAEKVIGFVYFRKGRGKMWKKNYKKKEKKFDVFSGGFLTIFGC